MTRRYKLLLGAILIVGLVLRLYGIDFGLPAINDTDELMFQMGAVKLLSGPTLNPGWFGHPATTTIYLLAVIDILVFAIGWVCGWFPSPAAFATEIYSNPTWVIMPGRIAMVAFGLLCIWLVYRLGRELFGHRVALVAALLMAVNPLHIHYSQVIRSDIMATAFMLLCLCAILRVARYGSMSDILWSAVWLALATITKWPFALTGLAMLGAIILRIRGRQETFSSGFKRLVIFGFATVILAVAFSPYIVLDYPTLIRNLSGEAQVQHVGATGGTILSNFIWYLSGPFWTSFGVIGCVMVISGALIAVFRHEMLALTIPVVFAFIAIVLPQNLVWDRWMLPLIPYFVLFAALAFVQLYKVLSRFSSTISSMLIVLIGAVVVIGSIRTAVAEAHERIYDTRQLATGWLREHAKSGSSVLLEHFAFDLVHDPFDFYFPMGDVGCVDAKKMLKGKIKYATIQASRGQRSNVDYGTIPAEVRSTCFTDYALLSQYDRYAAERDRFPDEYQSYRDLLERGQIVVTFKPVPGLIGGPVIRVVRFAKQQS